MKQNNSNSNAAGTLAGWLAIFALTLSAEAKTSVELPAGSVDGLAAAVASAGSGGTVLVKSGTHLESGTVVVSFPVKIIGEAEAVIKSGTSPGGAPPIAVLAVIHIKNTHAVTVQDLNFQPAGESASTAVVIENSPDVRVLDNTINLFQFGVVVQHGDNALIRGNTIHNDPGLVANGIIANGVMVNGASIEISDNTVSDSVFGLFASDRDGRLMRNNCSACVVGVILCHNPDGFLSISGNTGGAETFCTGWHVEGNVSTENDWGYEVIDGSHNNMLVNNAAADNEEYDIELAGDTARYSPFPPLATASHDNVVVAGSQKGLVVKNCGNNNVIQGDVTLLDNSSDPCF